MIPRKLSDEDADKLRKRSILADKDHFIMREFYRTNLGEVEKAIKYGDIYQEGRGKYQAVLPIKRNRILYVIFYDYGDYLEPVTTGITTRSKKRKIWG